MCFIVIYLLGWPFDSAKNWFKQWPLSPKRYLILLPNIAALINLSLFLYFFQFLLLRQMQRTVNNAVSSHNNMLVPDDEIVVERAPFQQEELLKKENQVLKVGHTYCVEQQSGCVVRFEDRLRYLDQIKVKVNSESGETWGGGGGRGVS